MSVLSPSFVVQPGIRTTWFPKKKVKKAKYCESIGYPEQGKFLRVLFAGDNYSTYIEHKDLIEVKDAA